MVKRVVITVRSAFMGPAIVTRYLRAGAHVTQASTRCNQRDMSATSSAQTACSMG